MLIDWFTVVAQVVNFLILVWLLKRFLYKPILRALDAREQQIALTLADADAKKAEAQRERDEFQHKNEAFDQQRSALLHQATGEVKAERERLLDQARQDADALRAERQDALKHEQQHLKVEITRRTREEVFAIARKTLRDLAGTSLEARMSEVFAQRLQALDDETKHDFTEAVKTSSEPVRVRSAFELSAEQRAAIQTTFNTTLSVDIPIRFETVPDLISGIELSVNGRKIAWSISDYLASLEKSIGELLAPSNPQAKTETELQPGARKVTE
jgi:F-type H+-transporting ATPase subunit b